MSVDNNDISKKHSDFEKFQKDEIWIEKQFDFVFCDDQIFRNHSQDITKHRQRCETKRLICNQLLIALRHVKIGDSMMILLHKIDSWNTVLTLRVFDRFANIAFFKSLTAHKARSSFYFVVKNIQSHHKNALVAVQDWIKIWKNATFRALTNERRKDAFSNHRDNNTTLKQQITKIMNEFGERLIALKENAWKIQQKTIRTSHWFKEKKAEESSWRISIRIKRAFHLFGWVRWGGLVSVSGWVASSYPRGILMMRWAS